MWCEGEGEGDRCTVFSLVECLFLYKALTQKRRYWWRPPAIADVFCPPSKDISETLTAFTVTRSRSREKVVFWQESGATSTSHHLNSVDICG